MPTPPEPAGRARRHRSDGPVRGLGAILWLLALTALLVGCSTGVSPTRPTDSGEATASGQAPSPLPEGRRYAVDPTASHLRIILGTEGPLAALGHPHVIGGPVISGTVVVTQPWQDSVFRLEIPVDRLEVDRAEWRAAEGLEPDVPEGAIAATRRNMLSETQLNAAAHPVIRLESLGMTGPAWQADVRFRVTIAGLRSMHTVPVAIEREGDRITATGQLRTRFSELGLAPYSALGGGLRVADELRIRFRVEAINEHSP